MAEPNKKWVTNWKQVWSKPNGDSVTFLHTLSVADESKLELRAVYFLSKAAERVKTAQTDM